MANNLSATILWSKRCFRQQCPIAIWRLIEQRHAITALQFFDFLLIIPLLVSLIEVHRLCNGTVRHQEACCFRRNRQLFAILAFDFILERHTIIIGTADDAIGHAILFKIQSQFGAYCIHMTLLRTDQVIRILDGFCLRIDEGQTSTEIAQVGDQARRGSSNNGISISRSCKYNRSIIAQGEQSLNVSIRRHHGPRVLISIANNDIQSRGLLHAVQFYGACNGCCTVRNGYDLSILYLCNGFVAAAVGDNGICQIRLDILHTAPANLTDVTSQIDGRACALLKMSFLCFDGNTSQVFLSFLIAIEASICPCCATAALCIQGQNLGSFRNRHFQSTIVWRDLISIIGKSLREDLFSICQHNKFTAPCASREATDGFKGFCVQARDIEGYLRRCKGTNTLFVDNRLTIFVPGNLRLIDGLVLTYEEPAVHCIEPLQITQINSIRISLMNILIDFLFLDYPNTGWGCIFCQDYQYSIACFIILQSDIQRRTL